MYLLRSRQSRGIFPGSIPAARSRLSIRRLTGTLRGKLRLRAAAARVIKENAVLLWMFMLLQLLDIIEFKRVERALCILIKANVVVRN